MSPVFPAQAKPFTNDQEAIQPPEQASEVVLPPYLREAKEWTSELGPTQRQAHEAPQHTLQWVFPLLGHSPPWS